MTSPSPYEKRILSTVLHPRLSEYGMLIYPVLSRRSQGVSIGINLNPDKVCNFGCVYCQVNRTVDDPYPVVSAEQVIAELRAFLISVQAQSGQWDGHPVKDIAFSGDGEPTTYPRFPLLVDQVLELQRELKLEHLVLRVITNASRFHIPAVLKALSKIVDHGGEIWAKLDAGDVETYQQLIRSKVSFERIMLNLVLAGLQFPFVLQSCFLQVSLQPFDPRSFDSYLNSVKNLLEQGCQIKRIQAYTLARPPAVDTVTPWSDATMVQIGELLRSQLPLEIEVFFQK